MNKVVNSIYLADKADGVGKHITLPLLSAADAARFLDNFTAYMQDAACKNERIVIVDATNMIMPAYLIRYMNHTVEEALLFINRIHKCHPTKKYREQLQRYYERYTRQATGSKQS